MDSDLIALVNKLQDTFNAIGGQAVDLPQIVVVGSQSSGKSSVLETDPATAGTPADKPTLIIIIIFFFSSSLPSEYGEFLHLPNRRFIDFAEIKTEIDSETMRVARVKKGISQSPIHLKIHSNRILNLTLVDLPGLTKIPELRLILKKKLNKSSEDGKSPMIDLPLGQQNLENLIHKNILNAYQKSKQVSKLFKIISSTRDLNGLKTDILKQINRFAWDEDDLNYLNLIDLLIIIRESLKSCHESIDRINQGDDDQLSIRFYELIGRNDLSSILIDKYMQTSNIKIKESGSLNIKPKKRFHDDQHAGYLLGLGLNQHLKSINRVQIFRYLESKHDMTSIGVLLGLSSTFIGTGDPRVSSIIAAHVPAMQVNPLIQSARFMGFGILHFGTGNRRISDGILREFGKTWRVLTDTPDDFRESYTLCAGLG
ncbi:P-loop containing nucleoside triphosphate hydrolase protein [Phakopsora pachyrhizi]|uniref:P-loop containing nucleoside triphosphate hydrolase protein n=1 Tax=Phakopsora pachyrhizi TaxID=170000 RepID=A0AAV0BV17_PHAPC|nr:P-loop containing nucleoside triphosphate hydrolase protein [Phakopsora pachyrhizi]